MRQGVRVQGTLLQQVSGIMSRALFCDDLPHAGIRFGAAGAVIYRPNCTGILVKVSPSSRFSVLPHV